MTYGILHHDYKNKSSIIIEWFTDKYNAIEKMQEYAYKFIYQNEGYKSIKIFDEGSHQRPFGYFIERNANKNINSLKIKFKKWKKGYVYGNAKFKNICLFSLVFTKKNKENIEYNDEPIEDIIIEHYKEVLNELEDKFEAENLNILPTNLEEN